MKNFTGYIGTYDSPQSVGIYQFTFDAETGILSTPQLFYRVKNAKCVALEKGLLVATVERNGKAGICLLDTYQAETPLLSEALDETQTSCFVAQNEHMIYTANYHEGVVLIYQRADDSLRLVKKIEIAPKAGAHQVLLHEQFILVPCLGLDAIYLFDRTKDFAPAGEISFPAGSGPRHGVFDRAHKRLFVLSELSHQLFFFRVDADAQFALAQTDSFLSPELIDQSASAAIRMSADERFIYISTRGADLITVFRIDGDSPELVQQVSSGGMHPRDFLIAPGGEFLLVVNRTTNELVSFRLNSETGRLEEICAKVPVHEGVGITIGAIEEN